MIFLIASSCWKREKVQLRWIGYRAASKLHCNESSGCDPPIPAMETRATLIASNSNGKVLPDLARNLQPDESRPCVLPWV
jgi:hypothetical protein